MPLALVVDSLDTVPETLRTEYTEKDGKFHLNVDGLPDVTGLKSALESERKMNKGVKDKIAAWEKLGKSPDEISEMLEAERVKAEDALKKAGKFDEVLAQHLGKAKQERDEAVSAAEKQRDSALSIARNAIMKSDLGAALVKGKATDEGMKALPKLLGDRIKIEFSDAGEATFTIMEADGNTPMVGSGKGGLATYDDLVAAAKKEFSSLFEGTGGGSGTDPNGLRRDAGGKTMTRKEFDALGPLERAEKIKAGWRIAS